MTSKNLEEMDIENLLQGKFHITNEIELDGQMNILKELQIEEDEESYFSNCSKSALKVMSKLDDSFYGISIDEKLALLTRTISENFSPLNYDWSEHGQSIMIEPIAKLIEPDVEMMKNKSDETSQTKVSPSEKSTIEAGKMSNTINSNENVTPSIHTQQIQKLGKRRFTEDINKSSDSLHGKAGSKLSQNTTISTLHNNHSTSGATVEKRRKTEEAKVNFSTSENSGWLKIVVKAAAGATVREKVSLDSQIVGKYPRSTFLKYEAKTLLRASNKNEVDVIRYKTIHGWISDKCRNNSQSIIEEQFHPNLSSNAKWLKIICHKGVTVREEPSFDSQMITWYPEHALVQFYAKKILRATRCNFRDVIRYKTNDGWISDRDKRSFRHIQMAQELSEDLQFHKPQISTPANPIPMKTGWLYVIAEKGATIRNGLAFNSQKVGHFAKNTIVRFETKEILKAINEKTVDVVRYKTELGWISRNGRNTANPFPIAEEFPWLQIVHPEGATIRNKAQFDGTRIDTLFCGSFAQYEDKKFLKGSSNSLDVIRFKLKNVIADDKEYWISSNGKNSKKPSITIAKEISTAEMDNIIFDNNTFFPSILEIDNNNHNQHNLQHNNDSDQHNNSIVDKKTQNQSNMTSLIDENACVICGKQFSPHDSKQNRETHEEQCLDQFDIDFSFSNNNYNKDKNKDSIEKNDDDHNNYSNIDNNNNNNNNNKIIDNQKIQSHRNKENQISITNKVKSTTNNGQNVETQSISMLQQPIQAGQQKKRIWQDGQKKNNVKQKVTENCKKEVSIRPVRDEQAECIICGKKYELHDSAISKRMHVEKCLGRFDEF